MCKWVHAVQTCVVHVQLCDCLRVLDSPPKNSNILSIHTLRKAAGVGGKSSGLGLSLSTARIHCGLYVRPLPCSLGLGFPLSKIRGYIGSLVNLLVLIS